MTHPRVWLEYLQAFTHTSLLVLLYCNLMSLTKKLFWPIAINNQQCQIWYQLFPSLQLSTSKYQIACLEYFQSLSMKHMKKNKFKNNGSKENVSSSQSIDRFRSKRTDTCKKTIKNIFYRGRLFDIFIETQSSWNGHCCKIKYSECQSSNW